MFELYTWIMSQYGSNEFLVGTTVPFALAAAGYLGARLWTSVRVGIHRFFTVSIRLNSDKPYYDEFCELITKEVIVKWSRQSSVLSYDYDQNMPYNGVGYGKNFGMLNGVPVIVERDQVESQSREFKEFVKLTAFTLKKASFLDKISNLYNKASTRSHGQDNLLVYSADPWLTKLFQKKKREWNTLLLPEGFVEELKRQMNKVIENRDEEFFTGNHTLGILLYGKPGTGKSSLAHAIVSELNKNMVYFSGEGDIADVKLGLKNALLLEDVDASSILCRTTDRDNPSEGGENGSARSMSNVLNFLDGPLTPPGLTVIATTNRIEDLDAAFIRPGRFSILINTDTMEIESKNK